MTTADEAMPFVATHESGIGTKRTCSSGRSMSALGGETDIAATTGSYPIPACSATSVTLAPAELGAFRLKR
jgi:hypothetical protein